MAANHDRTEKATPRRRQKAKDKGQFAYSQELTGVLTLFACLATAYALFASPVGFRNFLQSALNSGIDPDLELNVVSLIRRCGTYFLMVSAPIFAAAVVAALVGNVLQGLPIFATEAAGFQWDRLNPVNGLSRLKGKISPMEWIKIILLVLAAVAVFWSTLTLYWPQLIALPALPIGASTDMIRSMLVRIVMYLGVALVVLAAGDFFIQRWRFEQSIKMSKAEVKEDMKAMEGNPTIKGKIRAIQRERAKRRMMERLKDADVIVTNPTHYAVALEYKAGDMTAPRVVAKGRGWLAQKIKELGRNYDIPTVENVPLARALYRSVELEQEIPSELYKAVAEVLAFVFRVRNKK